MYDSRSDHARGGTHALRANREHGEGDRIEWSTPRTRVLATPQIAALEIAEGLEDYLAGDWEDQDFPECTEPDAFPEPDEFRRGSVTHTSEANKEAAMSTTTKKTRTTDRQRTVEAIEVDVTQRAIRRPRVAKHQPRLSDGINHPVTVRRVES